MCALVTAHSRIHAYVYNTTSRPAQTLQYDCIYAIIPGHLPTRLRMGYHFRIPHMHTCAGDARGPITSQHHSIIEVTCDRRSHYVLPRSTPLASYLDKLTNGCAPASTIIKHTAVYARAQPIYDHIPVLQALRASESQRKRHTHRHMISCARPTNILFIYPVLQAHAYARIRRHTRTGI